MRSNEKPAGLRTGEVAEQAGVNIQTLRYYERRGLLSEPARSTGGHRLYPPDTVALLGVIKAAQRLGFTLDEVAELLDAGRRRHPAPDLRQRAIDKIGEIDARIADLTVIRAALTRLVDARCDSLTNCTCTECPVPFLTIDSSEEYHRVREDLAKQDFAVTRDSALGLHEDTRPHICRTYFTESVLHGDHPAVHRDRDRARDVIRYGWHGDRLAIREHDVVAIRDRSGFRGTRTPTRVRLLTDVLMTTWVEAILSLIPPHLRQEDGTFGVNFLRTRTNVVAGPHQDDEEYVVIYVADKHGTGAETTLHAIDDVDRIVYRHTLVPGELIVFRDAAFLHNASPLISPIGGKAQRDALVCTVNYRDTYDLT